MSIPVFKGTIDTVLRKESVAKDLGISQDELRDYEEGDMRKVPVHALSVHVFYGLSSGQNGRQLPSKEFMKQLPEGTKFVFEYETQLAADENSVYVAEYGIAVAGGKEQ